MELTYYWDKLLWPLLRLLSAMAAGLLLANILESVGWTQVLAKLTAPVAKMAHMGAASSSAFALAFVSPAAANSLLAENYERGSLKLKELMLANLFNGLPAFLTHAPAIFLLTWPVLGAPAFTYVGITLAAACLRTGCTMIAGHFLLPVPEYCNASQIAVNAMTLPERLKTGLARGWRRFCKRLPRLVYFTAPIYIMMYLAQQYGVFAYLEKWLSLHLQWLTFINPQAISIMALQLVAEMGATLGAAGAVLADGALSERDVVLAMLAGNVLATPMRAIRHQLPSYSGFYRPTLALALVLANQMLRALSMIVMICLYLVW